MDRETPQKAGYYMPAEWATHEGTWLAWPTNPETFPSRIIANVERAYCLVISALSRGERAKVLVNDAAAEERVRRLLAGHDCKEKNVLFYRIKSADVWIRDYGPTFLLNRKTGKKATVKWKYNAYGGKYEDLLYDDITGRKVAEASRVMIFEPGMVLEGGSIDVDGKGMLITTEQCLLNTNRNPSMDRAQIEEYLCEYTGVSRIIWLKSGIEGDDTDGHVDDFARFAANGTVLCASGSEAGEKDDAVLKRNFEILKNETDAEGTELEVVKLPMPKPLVDRAENRQLPASYANFYVGNKVVLLPVFGDANDSEAIRIMGNSFPGRDIVPIMARELVFGYGGIHCITQQEPQSD